MRFGELAGLHVTDFNFKNATVKVQLDTFCNIEDTPKSQKGKRLVYLDARTLEAVRTCLDGRASGSVSMTRTGTLLKNGDDNRDVLKPL